MAVSVIEAATIIIDLLESISTAEGFIADFSENSMNAVAGVATKLYIIYVVIWGWAMARGMVQEPVADATMRFLKLAFILGLALNASYFSSYITDFVTKTPDVLAKAITGSDTSSTIVVVQVLGFALKIGSEFVIDAEEFAAGGAGVPDLSLLAVGIGVWGGGAALSGVIVGTLVIARIMLAILLALGPVFLVLIMFESTKKIFDAWLGHVLTYMIVIVATIIATQIIIAIMAKVLASYLGLAGFNWLIGSGFSPSVGTGIGLILTYGICGVAMQKVIAAADAIGRSVSITTYTGHK